MWEHKWFHQYNNNIIQCNAGKIKHANCLLKYFLECHKKPLPVGLQWATIHLKCRSQQSAYRPGHCKDSHDPQSVTCTTFLCKRQCGHILGISFFYLSKPCRIMYTCTFPRTKRFQAHAYLPSQLLSSGQQSVRTNCMLKGTSKLSRTGNVHSMFSMRRPHTHAFSATFTLCRSLPLVTSFSTLLDSPLGSKPSKAYLLID